MVIGSGRSQIVGAEPIRIGLALAVLEISRETSRRREILQFFGRSLNTIGRNGKASSGFLSSRNCASVDTPTRWFSAICSSFRFRALPLDDFEERLVIQERKD